MNNKKLGTAFERYVCQMLAQKGYWVHFITPDARGAQPFDVIAAKNRRTYAIDCKTCISKTFNINRLEENQKAAFDRWMNCGNNWPVIVIEHDNKVYVVEYPILLGLGKVKLGEEYAKDETTGYCDVWDFDYYFDRV